MASGSASKQKGSEFERAICVRLSLWVTVGKKKDCFWRSAMSGGRATVKRGEVRQAGDITAVAPEGHSLTDYYYIECKAYRTLDIASFLVKGVGVLSKFWEVTCREAKSHGRHPMLIAKQNNMPILVLTEAKSTAQHTGLAIVSTSNGPCLLRKFDDVMSVPYRVPR
jgi:hypothetical protein